MRTNIEIDDDLLRQAMEAAQEVSKKATVEAALRLTVRLKKQEGIRGLFGQVQWDGDLEAMRRGRVFDWEEEQRALDRVSEERSEAGGEQQGGSAGATERLRTW